jgi:hypothetical protein
MRFHEFSWKILKRCSCSQSPVSQPDDAEFDRTSPVAIRHQLAAHIVPAAAHIVPTIEKDYLSLKTSLQKNRQKRAMVDGGGRILNWLFGVSKVLSFPSSDVRFKYYSWDFTNFHKKYQTFNVHSFPSSDVRFKYYSCAFMNFHEKYQTFKVHSFPSSDVRFKY